MTVPAYVLRSISIQASCDLINAWGWVGLGVDDFDKLREAVETCLIDLGETVKLRNEVRGEECELIYKVSEYE